MCLNHTLILSKFLEERTMTIQVFLSKKINCQWSVNVLKAMFAKFDKTDSLKVQSCKGDNPVPKDTNQRSCNGDC